MPYTIVKTPPLMTLDRCRRKLHCAGTGFANAPACTVQTPASTGPACDSPKRLSIAGGADIFFHVSALQEGDEIAVGKAVSYEVGNDPKSGKPKAVSVDLV
jgi:cold shock CspA family protein